MKKYYLLLIAILSISLFSGCDDEDETPGQPQLMVSGVAPTAFFGDSLVFSAQVSDLENVPLSTLKARLFFGEDMVSETVIRTKTEGTYSGQLFVPFLPNIPNGTASLEFVVQNIEFATKVHKVDLPVSRPDFPYLTLVTTDGEYQMEKTGSNQYAASEDFPQKVRAVIKAPAFGVRGNEITFGWREGAVQHHSETEISFSNSAAGEYEVFFNTFTFQAGPFINLEFAGEILNPTEKGAFWVDLDLEENQVVKLGGISDFDQWSLPEGYLSDNGDGSLSFTGASGSYNVSIDFEERTISVLLLGEVLVFDVQDMTVVDENISKIEANLEQNQLLEFTGIDNIDQWWIDSDYFVGNDNGTLKFKAISGKYRVTANFVHAYFVVEAMSGDDLATLQADGSGALWIIGEGIGKPSLDNQVGWNPDNALCMAQLSPMVYQVTVVAGENVNASSINFKFFHQKNWGGEYTNNSLTTESDLIFVGNGDNGRDPGNLGLVDGVTLEAGKTYILKVDITAGLDNAVLTVTAE